ncbi:uncharacterized protein LOC112256276 [Oncorhynchus tshawytscha]|uniref:uncharacterized protein LOC112256276 n=1 Tax=Oncorhynchus tshawytscha TaxID=74940 RepID=UPI000D0A6F89|nr:uncharacterized protein LOC112256276 [Oncorhynchus tshawytscha]
MRARDGSEKYYTVLKNNTLLSRNGVLLYANPFVQGQGGSFPDITLHPFLYMFCLKHAGLLFHFIYIFSTHLSFSPVLVFCYRLPDHPFLSLLLQPPSLRSLTHSLAATSPDQGYQKPLQTTVVLMNSNSKISQGSGGDISVTTLCLDTPPAFKLSKGRGGLSFGTEWLSLLRPSTVNGTLKFSHSLNDVGQRMDSLCSGLHFVDRTCSEGELDVKPKQPNTDQKSKMFNGKAATLTHQASNHPPFPTHTPSPRSLIHQQLQVPHPRTLPPTSLFWRHSSSSTTS